MNDTIKIIVAHHKPGFVIKDNVYLPIQVGAALSPNKLDMQGDDRGDNISHLNPLFCEMTAVYWAWKNLQEKPDYIGLCHYRRYFTTTQMPKLLALKGRLQHLKRCTLGRLRHPGSNYMNIQQIYVYDKSEVLSHATHFSDVVKMMAENKEFDVIVPTKHQCSSFDLEMFFSRITGKHVIDVLDNLICNDYPDFYQYFHKSLKNTCFHPANMFIMRWNLFDDYCNMCFAILQKHMQLLIDEGWCIHPEQEGCFSRMSGYLFEMLTNAYLLMLMDKGYKYKIVNTLMYIEKS